MKSAGYSGSEDSDRSRLVPTDFTKNHFNTLRMAMALLVIWSHCFAIYYGTEDNEPISLLLNGQYNAGNIGVRVFFIISGFLITISYLRSRSLIDYLRKRVARIYPGFVVAVAVCAFVVIPLFSNQVDLSVPSIARTLGGSLLLRSNFPASDVFAGHPGGPAVNGALWSIPFEFWCYLGLIALGLSGMLKRRWIILFITAAIMATKTYLDIHGMKPGGGLIGDIIGWPYLWFSIAPSFLAGMLAYLYRDALPRSRWLAGGSLLALILSAHLSPLLCDALFPLVTAYLTFYIGFSARPLPEAARYGDFSYGTYLYGFAIQQMLIGAALPFFAYIPSAMILSVAAGAASWFLVEKRFLSRKRLAEFTGPDAPGAAAAAH